MRLGNLAGDGRGGFLLAAIIGAKRAVHVVKANNASFEPKVLIVVAAEFLGEKFLPTVAGFGVGGISVFLTQGRNFGVPLLALVVDASGGREQKAINAVLPACLQHIGVDQDVITADVCMPGCDIADAPHVGREIVDFIDAAAGGR